MADVGGATGLTARNDNRRRPRLLLMSYAFPPATAPEAMLSAKRAGHLAGWDVEVIAAAAFHPGLGNDPDMADYTAKRFRAVHRLTPVVKLPWHRLGLAGQIPDGMRILNHQASALALKLHTADPFDAVLSWSTYHSVHLAARDIQGRTGLPWLAHMSDPWTDNPFVTYGRISGAINRRLERQVIAACDRVLFTTRETVDLVMAKHPSAWRDKAVVIPHGFDAALYSGHKPGPSEGRPFIVRYLGNFYGVRTPEPVFRALGRILNDTPHVLDNVVVEFVGKVDPGMAESDAARRLPEGLVRVMPSVGYRKSLELMETADLLLIVDAPAELSVFLPSKLVDYLGAGRPILTLSPRGASQRVTEEAGFWCAPPDDVVAAASAFVSAIERVRSGNFVAAGMSQYSAEATGQRLAKVLSEVVASSGGTGSAAREPS